MVRLFNPVTNRFEEVDDYEYFDVKGTFPQTEDKPICLRCGKKLETEIDLETGICADCWEEKDYKNKSEKLRWNRNW